jgi:outer membrane lipoprotein-sorting protein
VTPSTILQRHRALRWLVPVGVLGAVAVAAGGMITPKATPEPLPPISPTALLAGVQSSDVTGFSGTVIARMSLGLPELPGMADERGDASMTGLLSGSHTLRVWYGGPERQRVALIGVTSETDVFHSGRDVWQWESDTHVATHTVLPAQHPTAAPRPAISSLTPDRVAAEMLKDLDPSTRVTLGKNRIVADRSAYDLVLTPRTSATRVGSVHLAIDGRTKLPLGVQVYARGKSSPAIDVTFSDVKFKKPNASYFSFTPQPGATVLQGMTDAKGAPRPSGREPTTIGSGWTTVLEYNASRKEIAALGGQALHTLTPVHGAWGSGRLLDSALLSVLITSDNRVFAGAVDPQALYSAAARHK